MANNFMDCEFFELNGKDTFMKLKANAFGMKDKSSQPAGKVQFAFVKFDTTTNKLMESMDVYMDMDDALVLAADILSGRIATLAQTELAKGQKYPGAIWESPLGGVNEEKAKDKYGRTDGKAISRIFNIAPGSRQPFIFTSILRPGHSNDKGMIVPEGKPEIQIRVPCDAHNLKKMAVAIQSYINAYRTYQFVEHQFDVKK